MKNLLFAILLLASCTKEVPQPQQETVLQRTQSVQSPNIIIAPSDWTYNSSISAWVYNYVVSANYKSAIRLFVNNKKLPYSTATESYSYTYFSPSVDLIAIEIIYSNSSLTAPSGNVDIRTLVLPPASQATFHP